MKFLVTMIQNNQHYHQENQKISKVVQGASVRAEHSPERSLVIPNSAFICTVTCEIDSDFTENSTMIVIAHRSMSSRVKDVSRCISDNDI